MPRPGQTQCGPAQVKPAAPEVATVAMWNFACLFLSGPAVPDTEAEEKKRLLRVAEQYRVAPQNTIAPEYRVSPQYRVAPQNTIAPQYTVPGD